LPDVILKKTTPAEVVRLFLEWDNDPEMREIFSALIEKAGEEAEHLSEVSFWAGVWYAKSHPDDVEIRAEDAPDPKPKQTSYISTNYIC
jgi:hypothetical protein